MTSSLLFFSIELTPSAPLLSRVVVEEEGGLSLTIFVFEYGVGVDIFGIISQRKFVFFVRFNKEINEEKGHCSPRHGFHWE